MTWASFDDGFFREAVWDGVPYDVRWHYCCMVAECCAGRRWDGRMPRDRALRCSDVPTPDEAIKRLAGLGLVQDDVVAVQIVYIEQHIPPEGVRPDHLLPRKRANQRALRLRWCSEGKHSKDCPPGTCPVKRAKRDAPS